MSGCRDCKQCTRSALGKFVWFFLRIVWMFFFLWNIGLFIKKCPQCKHYMFWHQKKEGRFID